MTTSEPVFVGQALYREMFNGRDKSEGIRAYTVSKIGRKYFYLAECDQFPISKENLKYEDKVYSQASFQLYKTKQEILDRQEKDKLFEKIRKNFDWSVMIKNYTLEQLREVVRILSI